MQMENSIIHVQMDVLADQMRQVIVQPVEVF